MGCGSDQDKTEEVKSFQKKFYINKSDFKENLVSSNVFKKLSVKVKRKLSRWEFLKLTLQHCGNLHRTRRVGFFYFQKEVITIDTRNDFEVELGTFEGSVNPDKSFHEF